MAAPRLPRLLCLSLLLAALLGAARPVGAEPVPAPTTRWYETFTRGQKTGWIQVTWSASTWQGKATVHDRTEIVHRTVRDMAGHKDTFETRTIVDLERDEDGSLWWQRVETVESGRTSREELTWTGAGYDSVETVEEQEKKVRVPLDAPVSTDAEAFLSRRARLGTLETGLTLTLRELDLRARRARESAVEVLGPEDVEGESGPVPAVKVVVRDPETKSEDWLWLDREGAFVRSRSDAGGESRRSSESRARAAPTRAASFGITCRSVPPLERVMSADRLWVDLHLAADPERKLPDLPRSPWSTAEPAVAEGAGGWRIPALLTAYDDAAAKATRPVPPAGFERELESTPLMPCGHPDLKAAVAEATDGETDARRAAERLARWVHDVLTKGSPDVAEASALQILSERRGDCSEHALLFVALCRTAGIPARRCSGWVNIGSDWGAHAWAEIWVGAWVGADPTTGEVGTAARYLFFGYPDDPASHPGVVSARISQRLSITATRIEEDGVAFDLAADPEGNVREGETDSRRWWLHVPSGVEARDLPAGWTLGLNRGGGAVLVRGPGVNAGVRVNADQGDGLERFAAGTTTFAGVPAVALEQGGGRMWVIHSRRRFVRVSVRTQDADAIAALERVLAPTVAERVTDPAAPPAPALDPVGRWTLDRAATRERLLADLGAGLEEPARSRALARIDALVARLTVTLALEADGAARLAIARGDPAAPAAPAPEAVALGAWSRRLAGDGRLDLALERAVEGAKHGVLEPDGPGGRWHLAWGHWDLVLVRAPASGPR